MLCLILLLPVLSFSEKCSDFRSSDECIQNTPWKEERMVSDVEKDMNSIYTNPDKKGSQRKWYGKVITYRFLSDSGSVCSAMSKRKMREEVDRAAGMWNSVPEANILLRKVEDVESQTESTIREDIRIKFSGCVHPAGRLDEDPDYLDGHGFGEGGEHCDAIFGHAFKFGDIHLNTLMTWTDEKFDKPQTGSFVQPYFYTIVLHELGHSLGIGHLEDKNSVMYWNFGGMRRHQELKLSQSDIKSLQQLYPLQNSQCADTDRTCAESYGKANGVDCRNEAAQMQCPRTCKVCGLCEGEIRDDYLKCDKSTCSNERERVYCMRTCNICSELCRELPEPNLVPMSWRLPLLPGEFLSVGCVEGFELQGNSDITCKNGEFPDPPTCVKSQPNCRDKTNVCARKIEENSSACKKKFMIKKCKKSCGLCDELI